MRSVLRVAMLAGVAMAAAWTGTVMAAASVPVNASLTWSEGAAILADDDARDRIVESIQRKYSARVVRVTEVVIGGKRVYELRLLSNQRVWMVSVDAETGREIAESD
jgi:hypothetical protein